MEWLFSKPRRSTYPFVTCAKIFPEASAMVDEPNVADPPTRVVLLETLRTVQQIVDHPAISPHDKRNVTLCHNHVERHVSLYGKEPINTHVCIDVHDVSFYVRVFRGGGVQCIARQSPFKI